MYYNIKNHLFSFFLVVFISIFACSNVYAHKREYWIAAVDVNWNYAPSGMNKIKPSKGLGPWGVTTTYAKTRFIQYTDTTYTTEVSQPQSRGILGPEIRAVEGDKIVIHFKNMSTLARSMHPHGLRYSPAMDGADFEFTNEPGAKVAAGDSFTYEWFADHDAAPGRNDPSSIMWAYHSHVDSVRDIYAGLVGTIVVIKKGKAIETDHGPVPKGVDKEFTTLFMVFNEEDGEEGGLMHSMNGYIFGNLEGYEVDKGDKVRWYLLGMGTEVDLHTAHWHGQTVLSSGKRTDVIELLPTSMKTVNMKAKNPGTWLYHCHVTDHISAGMMSRWTVNP